ncbi:hypothetical protein RSW44_24685, partial [Escherichia coli]|uniref:hypothetical protein n=1 Tax=Escherichia coli TaxID=562 RepID=UPI0028DE6579
TLMAAVEGSGYYSTECVCIWRFGRSGGNRLLSRPVWRGNTKPLGDLHTYRPGAGLFRRYSAFTVAMGRCSKALGRLPGDDRRAAGGS